MLEKNSIAQRRSAHSAIAPAEPMAGGVMVAPLQAEARWSLRLPERDVAALPAAAGFRLDLPLNRFHSHDGRTAARLGPDEWLLLAPEADAEMVGPELTAAFGQQHHSLVDVSHRNIAMTVSGSAAAAVLNAGCPLDLRDERFPPGHATRTLLGKCEILLFRLDGGVPAYRVECWRSFATYVSAFLTEAACEFHAR
jgi:sarcosine oxidase, subunit gamma